MGQEDMTDPARGYTSASYALSGKIMLSAIVILFTVVLLIICLHIYARCFLIRARRRNNTLRRRTHRRTTHLVFISDTSPSSQSLSVTNNTPVFISRGLEPSVLKSLPTFIYSTANKSAAAQDEVEEEVLECAVCLSEFEENEKGRLLPKCNHSFHIDCIDMWFHTHSTCPICRAPVNNPQISEPEKIDQIPSIQIVIESSELEPGSSSSSTEPCSSCLHEEIFNGVPSSSSSSTTTTTSTSSSGLNPPLLSVGARRKISELVGVSIEVPRREESFREEIQSGSPGSQGYKSPGSRILSLKRILSREKKPSLPSLIPSLSFCGSVSEIDPEKGIEEEEEEVLSPAVQTNR